MAVRLDVQARVTGEAAVNRLQRGIRTLGSSATTAAAQMRNLERAADRGRNTIRAFGTALNVGVVAGLAAAAFGLQRFVRDTIQAGVEIESLAIRFNVLFRSAEEGARAFQELRNFASRVPFSLEAIAAGSGNLATISANAEELAEILVITGNVAAATGLPFELTAQQIQRAFANGAAAADLFRDRGVNALAGFQSGVQVTAEATRQRFTELFSGQGPFARTTDELAQTLQGQVSLVQDAYFNIRTQIAEGFFGELTSSTSNFVAYINNSQLEIRQAAQSIARGFTSVIRGTIRAVRFLANNFDTLAIAVRAFIAIRIASSLNGIISLFASFFTQLTVGTTTVNGLTAAVTRLNLRLATNPFVAITTGLVSAIALMITFREEIGRAIDGLRTLAGAQSTIGGEVALAERRAEIYQRQLENARALVRAAAERRREEQRLNNIYLSQLTLLDDISTLEDGLIVAGFGQTQAEIDSLNNQNRLLVAKQQELRLLGQQESAEARSIEAQIELNNLQIASGRNINLTGRQLVQIRRYNEAILRRVEQINEARRNGTAIDPADAVRIPDRPIGIPAEFLVDTQALANAEAQARSLRSIFAEVGVTSQDIGRIVADSWIQGFREGESVLQRIQNAGRNILNFVVETIVRKTIERQIDTLLNVLDNVKVTNNARISNSIQEQNDGLREQINLQRQINGQQSGSQTGGTNTPRTSRGSGDPGVIIPEGGLLESFRNFFTNITSNITNIFNGNFGNLFSNLTSGFTNVFNNLGGLLSNLGGSISSIISSFGGGGGAGGLLSLFGFNQGGLVPGGGPNVDSVPALLTPGERVLSRAQTKIFDGIVGLNKGGLVGEAFNRSSSVVSTYLNNSRRRMLKFQTGGLVPSVNNANDIQSRRDGSDQAPIYNTTINQNLQTDNLNSALISAIRTNAEEVNNILETERVDR